MNLVRRTTTALGLSPQLSERQLTIKTTLQRFMQSIASGTNLAQMGSTLTQWMQRYQISEQELQIVVDSFQNVQAKNALRVTLQQCGVLTAMIQAESMPLAMPLPVTPGVTVVDPVDQISETPMGFYEGNILADLARTQLSVLISASSGCGKSTTQQAICYLKHRIRPDTQFIYIDLQSQPFLGLEHEAKTAFYFSGAPEDIFSKVHSVCSRIYSNLDARLTRQQQCLRQGQPEPKFSPLWLVFNEWSGFWQQVSSSSVSTKEQNNLLAMMVAIITRGRGAQVGCILTAQVHRKTDIGLPPGVVRNMSLLGLGRKANGSPDGDFSSIEAAMEDNHIVAKSQARPLIPLLRQGIAKATNDGSLLAFCTQGGAKLGFIPADAMTAARAKITDYKYSSGSAPTSKIMY